MKGKNTYGHYCNLIPEEVMKRRAAVIANLRKHLQEIRELPDGYSFRFPGRDAIIDALVEFIKTERVCCPFFQFYLVVKGGDNACWLEMTGGEGVKEFISAELGII